MVKETGGPAFPVPDSECQIQDTGMTLRDYFAAKAMQAMITEYASNVNPNKKAAISIISYSIADEMLKARGKDND